MSEESKSWYRMTRPLFNSGFEDDEFWAYGQDGFHEVLDSFIGSDVLIYDKAIYRDPTQARAIVQQNTSDAYSSSTVRQILCNIGILHCGQYVKYEGAWYLVISYPDNNRIYEKAVLWKCKHTIRMLSRLTGDVVEYPVYSENSTQYGTGEAEKTQITVGDDQHLIYLPYNDETILLDNGFRFLMDKNRENPTAYRITRVDPVSYAVGDEKAEDGLIQWAVIQDLFNERTDNAGEMIADYYSISEGESISTDGGTGKISLVDQDGDFCLAIGEKKYITVSHTTQDGTVEADEDHTVSVDAAEGAVSWKENGNIVELSAADDMSLIGQTVTVKAVSNTLDSEATITIKIVNW